MSYKFKDTKLTFPRHFQSKGLLAGLDPSHWLSNISTTLIEWDGVPKNTKGEKNLFLELAEPTNVVAEKWVPTGIHKTLRHTIAFKWSKILS